MYHVNTQGLDECMINVHYIIIIIINNPSLISFRALAQRRQSNHSFVSENIETIASVLYHNSQKHQPIAPTGTEGATYAVSILLAEEAGTVACAACIYNVIHASHVYQYSCVHITD